MRVKQKSWMRRAMSANDPKRTSLRNCIKGEDALPIVLHANDNPAVTHRLVIKVVGEGPDFRVRKSLGLASGIFAVGVVPSPARVYSSICRSPATDLGLARTIALHHGFLNWRVDKKHLKNLGKHGFLAERETVNRDG